MPYERYVRLYKVLYSEQEETAFKRRDIKERLIEGRSMDDIAPVLFADNPKGQKLKHDFETQVVDKAARDRDILVETRLDWIKTSMTVSPEQLPATKEYAKLLEAYARKTAYIRFVPRQKVPDEPPCAGTDYKP
jgi:hypothetical protein